MINQDERNKLIQNELDLQADLLEVLENERKMQADLIEGLEEMRALTRWLESMSRSKKESED